MEPKSHEQIPSPVEATPIPPLNPEQRSTNSYEQLTPTIEIAKRTPSEQIGVGQPVMQLPTPVVVQEPVQTNSIASPVSDDTNPQVAADEDLIEKEWVDKAKKIIAETKDDPHAREQQVGKLQIDYLKKRYGKEIGNQE